MAKPVKVDAAAVQPQPAKPAKPQRAEATTVEVAEPVPAPAAADVPPAETPSRSAVETEVTLEEGDQHLALVSNLTQGSWFEMLDEGGQQYRCRLAAIIQSTGTYIFVNRSGMTVAEETREGSAPA